jgi:hypothetical protein
VEVSISDADAKTIEFNSTVKKRLVQLVHQHLGLASVVTVKVTENPDGVSLRTARGTIVVGRDLAKRIDS